MTSNRMTLVPLLALAALLFAPPAEAQRSGQSMSIQTGVVIAAQAVNLQSAAGRGVARSIGPGPRGSRAVQRARSRDECRPPPPSR